MEKTKKKKEKEKEGAPRGRGMEGGEGPGGEEVMNNRVGLLKAPLIKGAMEEEIELNLVVPMMEVGYDDGEEGDDDGKGEIESEEKAKIEKVGFEEDDKGFEEVMDKKEENEEMMKVEHVPRPAFSADERE